MTLPCILEIKQNIIIYEKGLTLSINTNLTSFLALSED